jgi:hypothetical protein
LFCKIDPPLLIVSEPGNIERRLEFFTYPSL